VVGVVQGDDDVVAGVRSKVAPGYYVIVVKQLILNFFLFFS
jgi:hypothetical protein